MSEQGGVVEQGLLTARQLAVRLGNVSIGTIYKMSSKGLLPSIPWGANKGGRRFIEAEVRAALAKLQAPLKEYHGPRASTQSDPAA